MIRTATNQVEGIVQGKDDAHGTEMMEETIVEEAETETTAAGEMTLEIELGGEETILLTQNARANATIVEIEAPSKIRAKLLARSVIPLVPNLCFAEVLLMPVSRFRSLQLL